MTDHYPPCPFECDVQLSKAGYYAIGGRARWFVTPETVRDLGNVLMWVRLMKLPAIVMGKGSNMLFSDENFPGVVISLGSMRRMYWISEHELFCEAGVENTDVAKELLEACRSGGEWLYRLPGMIGSTVRMNGRCYGHEISEVVQSIITVTTDGTVYWHEGSSVFKGYKHTSLMERPEVVAAVVLRFETKHKPEEIRELMNSYERDRIGKHQFDYPSCGSTFKNNYEAGRPSGSIFEALGFKGRQIGGARVSDHHANFIFNTGNASAADVLCLAGRMRQEALCKDRVSLDLEVQCAGVFNDSQLEPCGIAGIADGDSPGKSWAGLLWHPSMKSDDEKAETYPRTLLQGNLVDYFFRDGNFPDGIRVEIQQLVSLEEAKCNPGMPFLVWTNVCRTDNSFPYLPERPGGEYVDELWKYSVSELFIGKGSGNAPYLEFEMTPGRHWVALRFDDVRSRSAGYEIPSSDPWMGKLSVTGTERSFGMQLTYDLLQPFIDNDMISLQCASSLGGGRYGLFPWWQAQTAADFHRPDAFYRVLLT
jgi:UDP-N-acetylmuramate dehydrogenase